MRVWFARPCHLRWKFYSVENMCYIAHAYCNHFQPRINIILLIYLFFIIIIVFLFSFCFILFIIVIIIIIICYILKLLFTNPMCQLKYTQQNKKTNKLEIIINILAQFVICCRTLKLMSIQQRWTTLRIINKLKQSQKNGLNDLVTVCSFVTH